MSSKETMESLGRQEKPERAPFLAEEETKKRVERGRSLFSRLSEFVKGHLNLEKVIVQAAIKATEQLKQSVTIMVGEDRMDAAFGNIPTRVQEVVQSRTEAGSQT